MTREQFEEMKKKKDIRLCIYQYLGASKGQYCFASDGDKVCIVSEGCHNDSLKTVSYKSVDLL